MYVYSRSLMDSLLSARCAYQWTSVPERLCAPLALQDKVSGSEKEKEEAAKKFSELSHGELG